MKVKNRFSVRIDSEGSKPVLPLAMPETALFEGRRCGASARTLTSLGI